MTTVVYSKNEELSRLKRGLSALSLSRSIRNKLVVLLLVFGIVPALAALGAFLWERPMFERMLNDSFSRTAETMLDVIDRNLFERYGDVQSFGLNALAIDPANWRKPEAGSPLITAMNAYMRNYGVYKLMLLVDPKGQVLAANSMDASGKALATAPLYDKSYADAAWFKKALAGEFLMGRNGLTGTVVEGPAVDADVAALYSQDGYVMTFAAPVHDSSGQVVAVWANFADFGLVEGIVGEMYARMAREGMPSAELTLLDDKGRVIVDYDPTVQGFKEARDYQRNFKILGQLNLVEKGVEAAVAAARGERGAMVSLHARKGILQVAGFSHSDGAYDYPGLGWSALARAPVGEVYAQLDQVVWTFLIVIAVAALMIAAMGYFVGAAAARPIRRLTDVAEALAKGDVSVEILARNRRDEIGAMAKAVQVFKENLIENRRLVEEQKRQEAERKRQMEEQRLKLETDLSNELGTLVDAAVIGDFSKRIDVAAKSGFIAKLGENLNRLVATVGNALSEVLTMMGSMAQGDLSKRISGDYHGEFLKLKTDANATAEKLAEIVGQTVEGMANIKASTTEIATGATDLSSRTEEQVASLEEIAASIRQLNSTVQQSAENAGQASQLAMAARTSAEGGGEVAGAAVKAMGEIEQSSQKISDIVGMIDEIAFQTNLLALNAAVEAARAGEAGRGFAVVAGEVRTLAQRSSQASKEIKTLISNSNTQVKQGVELVNKAGSTLGEIVTAVKRVSDIVAEIAAANKEQSASVGEVQEAIGQIEQATQQNAALVEETTAALGSADNQVQAVTDVIGFFKSDAVVAAKPANAPAAPTKGAKIVQVNLAAKVSAGSKPNVSPAKTSGSKKIATGTDDGWEEF